MLVEFTEFNTAKLAYIDHTNVAFVGRIENADKGAIIECCWNGRTVFVQESPYEVAKKFNEAEKTVENY